ncbi:AAA family ATPase [Archangium primigenium]|uniref:AAA family ATPase n=1 Tax=[Archangium] primigenium TaxID=2792470 RepID=UPI00195D9062|nr:AAA family ATPase [Archangium primigenium]MBM7112526.1 AAA family ATPase [Archangium primigenium]
MALKSFTVANYRSFLRPTTVELRPLTLLFGYNNSGKSALLRVLPLLANSVGEPRGAPLNLDSPAVRGAAFRELCSQLNPNQRHIDFTLEWDGASGLRSVRSYQFRVREQPGAQGEVMPPVVEHFDTEFFDQHQDNASYFKGRWQPRNVMEQARYDTRAKYQGPESEEEADILDLAFRGIKPSAEPTPPAHWMAFTSLGMQLNELRDEVQWLGSIRQLPNRSLEFRGSAPARLKENGAGVLEMLVQDKLQGGALLATLSAWFEKHTRQRLEVSAVAPRYYALTLGPLASPGVRVNVIDTGEGMAQVLPVLVAAAQARIQGSASTLTAIEQPELHLHPKLHEALADFFCVTAMRENAPCALIETHSENFLQGIQLAIVQGRLDPQRVALYWVQQIDDGSSTLELITFNDKGQPSHWPPGVFSEDTELARRILKERWKEGT